MDVTPGTPVALSERYELLERLGAGSMGEVWRGRHTLLGHEVACKLMKPESAGDHGLVGRFLREAQIAARLRHRNIARVEDFGVATDGRPFLVMELLRGRSLESLLLAQGPLPSAMVALVAQHVGAACDVAHAAGIVHRDLKPENCFMVADEDGAALVKVLDFGVARVTDGLVSTHQGKAGTAAFTLLGTPVYMSPEQARGQKDLDGRSDLWSLAVLLYELLTGRLPYDAETLPQLLCAVLTEPIPPPSRVLPTLPTAVDTWAEKAFQRDRDARFQSGRELAQALTRALGLAPVLQVQAPPSVPPPAMLPSTVPEFAAATLHPSPNATPQGFTPSLPPTRPMPEVPAGAIVPAHATPVPWAPAPASPERPSRTTVPRGTALFILAGAVSLGLVATTAFLLGTRSVPGAPPARPPAPVVLPLAPTPVRFQPTPPATSPDRDVQTPLAPDIAVQPPSRPHPPMRRPPPRNGRPGAWNPDQP
ncbi:MAG: protein kinase [Deltaproteobacteria bacterium]|nr:protein kinase [Deltaproteobacteria bacterium]